MNEVFEKKVEIEQREEKIDSRILRKKSSAHSFKGWLIGRMKIAVNEKNQDVASILQTCYKKCLEFENKTKARVELSGWKGKSGIKIIVKPDSFDVINFQKRDQDSKPKEIRRNITKQEVNEVISVLNQINERDIYLCKDCKKIFLGDRVCPKCCSDNIIKTDKIPSRIIGEMCYDKEWDDIFSDRFLHTEFNLIMRLLDYYNIIVYRGGYSTIINKVLNIQTCLE